MYKVYHIHYSNDLNEGYIGVSKNLESRFYNHLHSEYLVGRGIRKHNLTSKDMSIVAEYETAEEAFAHEIRLRPEPQIGWNIARGGDGGHIVEFTEERRQHMSMMNLGKNNPYYGKYHSKEVRSKISETLLAKPEEWRKSNASNGGKANKGISKSDEGKANMSKSAKNRPKYTCPHCNKTGQYNSMIAWHGNNCKHKI